MAKKRQRSLLQMQREKLKAQKLGAKNTSTVARGVADMLFNKKEIKKVQSTKDALNRNRRGRIKQTRAAVGGKGSGTKGGTPKRLPPGKKGGPLVKGKPALSGAKGPKGLLRAGTSALGKTGRILGGAGLIASGVSTAKDLSDSLKRGEGYAKLLKKGTTQGKATKGGQGGSRASVKKKEAPKPKRQVTKRNRRGRPIAYADPKPAKRGLSNIPPKEGTGKGSPNDKKKVTKVSAPAAKKKSVAIAPKPPSATPKKSVTRDTSKDQSRSQLKYGSGSKKSVTRDTSKDTKKKKPMSRNKRNLLRRQGRL